VGLPADGDLMFAITIEQADWTLAGPVDLVGEQKLTNTGPSSTSNFSLEDR